MFKKFLQNLPIFIGGAFVSGVWAWFQTEKTKKDIVEQLKADGAIVVPEEEREETEETKIYVID